LVLFGLNFSKIRENRHCIKILFRKDFKDGSVTPKSILHTYTLDNNLKKPIYITEEKKPERVYKCAVEVNDVIYTTPNWYKYIFNL
jgi:hypothetical protein